LRVTYTTDGVTVVKKKLEQSAAPVRVGLRRALKQLSSLHPGFLVAASTLVAAKAIARMVFMNILTADDFRIEKTGVDRKTKLPKTAG
jgi:hypothetical protein